MVYGPINYGTYVLNSAANVVDGTILGDLPCARCSYNLRTLRAGGACPECALPVANSIDAEDRRARMNWRYIAYGSTCVALVCLANLVTMALTQAPYFQWFNIGSTTFYMLGLILELSGGLLLVTGVIFLMAARPARLRAHHWTWIACIVLVCARLVNYCWTSLFYFSRLTHLAIANGNAHEMLLLLSYYSAGLGLVGLSSVYMMKLARSSGKRWVKPVTALYALLSAIPMAYWLVYYVSLDLKIRGLTSPGYFPNLLSMTVTLTPALDFLLAVPPLAYWMSIAVAACRMSLR